MELMELAERMEAAVMKMESAMARMESESVGPIVATVESEREAELAKKLEEAEARIAELQASAGRKTASAGVMSTKLVEGIEAGSLDTALAGLSVEQRIAVKAELLRTGMIG